MAFSSTRVMSVVQVHACSSKKNIHDDVMNRLQSRLSTLRLGDPLDKNTDIGAVNSKAQLERITEIANSGDSEGATRWTASCGHSCPGLLVSTHCLHQRADKPPHCPG